MTRRSAPVGTERTMTDGRVRVKTADRGWVQRAQLVAEEILDRRLHPGERVTHGPAGKSDDRPENLRLQSSELLLEVAASEQKPRSVRPRRPCRPRRIISAAVDPELHARLKTEADTLGETLPKLAVRLLREALLGDYSQQPATPNLSHVNLTDPTRTACDTGRGVR